MDTNDQKIKDIIQVIQKDIKQAEEFLNKQIDTEYWQGRINSYNKVCWIIFNAANQRLVR